MNSDEAIWYLPGDSDQPVGPYTAAEVTEALQAGRCTAATLCWCEGMDDWQSLTDVAPFAGELARQRAAAKKRAMRIAAVVVVVACLVGAGVAAYIVVMGPPEVRRAKKFIAAGFYEEAIQAIAPYVAGKPLDHRARYLLAIAQLNKYATGDAGGGLAASFVGMSAPLDEVQEHLRRVFEAEPEWMEKAREDVAAAAARLPADDGEGLTRHLAIARLRAELNLAETRALAAELMDRAASSVSTEGSGVVRDQEALLQILQWDSSHAGQAVEWVIAGGMGSEYGLRTVLSTLHRWTAQRPELAEPVTLTLLGEAQSLYNANRRTQAKAVLLKVLEIDPDVATTQEHAMLCFKLRDPDEAKLKQYRYFLQTSPKHPYVADVLRMIVKDAVTAFDKYGRWQRANARPYLEAGLEMANRLVQGYATMEGLDADVYELAKRLTQDGQTPQALALTMALLAALPETPLRLAIEQDRTTWRQQMETAAGGPGIRLPQARGPAAPSTPPIAPRQPMIPGADAQSVRESVRLPARITSVAALKQALLSAAARRVLWVALGKDEIDPDTRRTLRVWIQDGGVVWVETDLATVFGFDGLGKDDSTDRSGQAQVAGLYNPQIKG